MIKGVLHWTGRRENALVLLLAMAALLVLALIIAVLGWTTAREAQGKVDSIVAAARAEDRAKARSDYSVCIASTQSVARVNRVLLGIRADYLRRARASEDLAGLDPPGSPERALRLETAAELRRFANAVFTFPVRTRQACADARDCALSRLPEPGTTAVESPACRRLEG